MEANLPIQRTPEQEAEFQHCLVDAQYFIETYCVLKSDMGKGLIPFSLFPYQQDLLRDFEAYNHLIVLKARQLGITELVAAYAVWTTLRPRYDVVVLSQTDDDAAELLYKAYTSWSNLPDWLRVPAINSQKISRLELVNGSRIIPKPATKRAGRGFNAQLLIFDEWAWQEFQEQIFAAAYPTISAGNRFIGLSSANGVGNLFYDQWQLAQGGHGMHPVFLPWHVRPGRDAAWYEDKREKLQDWKLAQEFPSSAQEAFILSGRPRFDIDALSVIGAGCVAPTVVTVGADPTGRPAGFLRTWAIPVPHRRYVVGVDTAEGLPNGDYSVAVVLDREDGVEVAELHGHWAPGEFANHVAALCRRYNTAYLGVELNNHGHAVILALRQVEGYPDSALYRHKDYDARKPAIGRYGWQTTTKSKPLMIDRLAQAIAECRPYKNTLFVTECMTYTVGDNGDTAASGNLHDDRVIAYAIAEQLRVQPAALPAVGPTGIMKASVWRGAGFASNRGSDEESGY